MLLNTFFDIVFYPAIIILAILRVAELGFLGFIV